MAAVNVDGEPGTSGIVGGVPAVVAGGGMAPGGCCWGQPNPSLLGHWFESDPGQPMPGVVNI